MSDYYVIMILIFLETIKLKYYWMIIRERFSS